MNANNSKNYVKNTTAFLGLIQRLNYMVVFFETLHGKNIFDEVICNSEH